MIGTCETCKHWANQYYANDKPYLGECSEKRSVVHSLWTRPEESCIVYQPKPDTRQSVMDELKALGVSEPTEEERFLRREEDKTRRLLRKTDIKGEGGTEHG